MTRRIIFDEFEEVARLFEKGFLCGAVNKYDLALLAKYYRNEGYSFEKIKSLIIDFCKQQDESFSPVVCREMINNAINTAKKYKLKENRPHVIITKAEIDAIKHLDRTLATIVFTMLVIAKYEKFNSSRIERRAPEDLGYYCRHEFEDILVTANIRVSKKDVDEVIYKLVSEEHLIAPSMNASYIWKINFANDESEPFLLIDDLDDIPSKLPFICEDCGCIIEHKSKHHNKCPDCYKGYRREVLRISKKKSRNKEKNT